MTNTMRVGMAQLGVAHRPDNLETVALGSCVGIVLYDLVTGVAGLIHAMLPSIAESRSRSAEQRSKFVDSAIQDLLGLLVKEGAQLRNVKAKLAGGANMFPEIRKEGGHIGEKNVTMAKTLLEQMNIPIVAEETGGTKGRTIIFDTTMGLLTVKTVAGEVKVV